MTSTNTCKIQFYLLLPYVADCPSVIRVVTIFTINLHGTYNNKYSKGHLGGSRWVHRLSISIKQY